MEIDESAILEKELAKVGAIGGFVGGLVPGAIGGYLGAKLSARFVPTQTYGVTFQIPAGAEEALRSAFEILRRAGHLTNDASDDPSAIRLSGVVGSGKFGMNPAIVVITITAGPETGSTITIAGAAKEGLIKQRTAEKAVNWVKELFLEAYPVAG